MHEMNRMANATNPYQGKFKRVLCVCSAGLLRSPTAAVVLAGAPFNFNTRAAGIVQGFALIPIDTVLVEWADEIVVMEPEQKGVIEKLTTKPIVCLDIRDNFEYRDPELMKLIADRYLERQGYGETKA